MTQPAPRSSKSRATGPRTAEGRARVAQNARKHGLTRTSPDTAAIAHLVESWLADRQMQNLPRAVLWRLAETRLQVDRTVAHQAVILDQLSGAAMQGQAGHFARPSNDDVAMKDLALSMRYRAEAESRARAALRNIILFLAKTNQTDGAEHATR